MDTAAGGLEHLGCDVLVQSHHRLALVHYELVVLEEFLHVLVIGELCILAILKNLLLHVDRRQAAELVCKFLYGIFFLA